MPGASYSVSLNDLTGSAAPRPTSVIPIHGGPLRAIGGNLIDPIDYLAVTPMLINQMLHSITARTPALVTRDAQHIELADEVTEYDCAVAGHNDNHRTASERIGGP